MKYMFASDVHGSAYYCRLMLEKYNEAFDEYKGKDTGRQAWTDRKKQL